MEILIPIVTQSGSLCYKASCQCSFCILHRLDSGSGPFHTHLKVTVSIIVKDPTVIVKCRSAKVKALFMFIYLCLCVMLDSLYVHLHSYPFSLQAVPLL